MPAPTHEANLQHLADQSYRRDGEEVFEATAAGGGGMVLHRKVEVHGVQCEYGDDGLEIEFSADGASLGATTGALDLPRNWRQFATLRAEVRNGPGQLSLCMRLLDARCRMERTHTLGPDEEATIEIDLADLPLAAGIRTLYEPNGVRLIGGWEGAGPRELTLRRLALEGAAEAKPCVDRFGQRANAEWPGKIQSEQQLAQSSTHEADALAALPALPGRDRYGGWTAGPTFEASGFFRVERDPDGRFWLVDPLGNPFWSMGITCVRTHEVTPVAGREFLYQALPDRDGSGAEAICRDKHGWEGMSFYRWNLVRKYPSLDAWQQRVIERFGKWGINTFACWCEQRFLDQTEVPHTRFMPTRSQDVPLVNRRFPDIYDPAWESWLDGQLANLTAPCVDNPWLVGYFIDNEAPWRHPRLLGAAPRAALRDRWLEFARRRYASLEAFNAEWHTSFADWSGVRRLRTEDVPAEGPARHVMHDFEAEYADHYFATVARLLKKHDPNHLYLGCRFVRKPPHEGIVAAMGRHTDVLSVNCYRPSALREEFDAWHRMSGGKPIVVGEYHLPLAGPRQLPPLWRCYSEAERRQGYAGFVRDFARMPYSLGFHWFQHADQPLTGRASNGENQIIGFVDITDQPHVELVAAAREAAEHVYQWHAEAR